jgi:hypothetical protein
LFLPPREAGAVFIVNTHSIHLSIAFIDSQKYTQEEKPAFGAKNYRYKGDEECRI